MEHVRKIISEELQRLYEEEQSNDVGFLQQELKHARYMWRRLEEENQKNTELLVYLHDSINAEIGTIDCETLLNEIYGYLKEWRFDT
jgi:hypothetical protein